MNNKIELGEDVEIVEKDIAKLRKQLKENGRDYITYVSIRATKLELLDE